MDEQDAAAILERAREGVGLAYNQTSLSLVGLAACLILGLAMLLLPRRHAVVPMLIMACFFPAGQRLAIFTLDFTLIRILVLFGWARIIMRREDHGFSWKTIDKVVIVWVLARSATYILLHGDMGSFIYKMGGMFDCLGLYFLFRLLIRDWEDLIRVVKSMAFLALPVGVFVFIEFSTARNLFSVMGGVPEITRVREGRLRCQGAFVHPIAAGCFFAGMIPLYAWLLFRQGKEKLLGIAASFCGLLIIFCCASSTPVASTAAGIAAMFLYPLRGLMRWIRWGALACVISLHMAMESPVWSLIARTDFVGGSTGYHRFQLVNQAILRVDEWWLLGTKTTAHWGHFLFDVANNYVSEGVRGGLISLVLFVWIIGLAFQGAGRMMRVTERRRSLNLLSWLVGVSLFVHCVSFVALNYSAQNEMQWLLMLGLVGSLTPVVFRRPASSPAQPAQPARPVTAPGPAVGPARGEVRRWPAPTYQS